MLIRIIMRVTTPVVRSSTGNGPHLSISLPAAGVNIIPNKLFGYFDLAV